MRSTWFRDILTGSEMIYSPTRWALVPVYSYAPSSKLAQEGSLYPIGASNGLAPPRSGMGRIMSVSEM